jgi:hypothetical protein
VIANFGGVLAADTKGNLYVGANGIQKLVHRGNRRVSPRPAPSR